MQPRWDPDPPSKYNYKNPPNSGGGFTWDKIRDRAEWHQFDENLRLKTEEVRACAFSRLLLPSSASRLLPSALLPFCCRLSSACPSHCHPNTPPRRLSDAAMPRHTYALGFPQGWHRFDYKEVQVREDLFDVNAANLTHGHIDPRVVERIQVATVGGASVAGRWDGRSQLVRASARSHASVRSRHAVVTTSHTSHITPCPARLTLIAHRAPALQSTPRRANAVDETLLSRRGPSVTAAARIAGSKPQRAVDGGLRSSRALLSVRVSVSVCGCGRGGRRRRRPTGARGCSRV